MGAVLLVSAAVTLTGRELSHADPDSSAPSTTSAAPSTTESAAPSTTESATESPTSSTTATTSAPAGSATGGHQVTYTVTATSDLTGNITYIKADPPSMSAYNADSSAYLESVHVPIAGGRPVVYTTTLADPAQWALVTASGGLRVNPELHCEIAVDGEVVVSQQGGSGVSCATRPW